MSARAPGDPASRVLRLARREKIISSARAESQGATRATLARLVKLGALRRVARGLYALPDADFDAHISLVLAQRQVPNGVVCLLSALELHELTTQSPHQVWIAVPHKG